MHVDESKQPGEPFRDAVRTGAFAWVYWILTGASIVAVAVGIFGDLRQRIVTGAITFAVIVALTIVRYVVAARIRRRQ